MYRAASFLFFITVFDGFPINFYLVPYVAILSQPLLILVLSLILFRHFQKFSKLLQPFRFHRSGIHLLSIMLQPSIIFASLFGIIFRWIPFVGLNKHHHLIVSRCPSFVLRHTYLILINFTSNRPSLFQFLYCFICFPSSFISALVVSS